MFDVFSYHKIWVLVLHGLTLLDCPQPVGHDNPHREKIQNELIHQTFRFCCYVVNVLKFVQMCAIILHNVDVLNI